MSARIGDTRACTGRCSTAAAAFVPISGPLAGFALGEEEDLLLPRGPAAHDLGAAVVDVVLAAVDTVAVVYVMRGAFKRLHLLAEARRHLACTLRGRPYGPGLDDQIVQAVVDDYTHRMKTAARWSPVR